MSINRIFIFKYFLVFLLLFFVLSSKLSSEEENTSDIISQVQKIREDIKTLEKAVYSSNSSNSTSSTDTSGNTSVNEDILTRHLLKLSEIEEQFQMLTNKFEEINFKIDKISNRITKIQSDNQFRFQEIEKGNLNYSESNDSKKVKKLPGSSEAQDLGYVSENDINSSEQVQQTQSIDSAGTVTTEKAERAEKLLPDKSPEKQYEFAINILKVGDYETAELALREFVDTNSEHKLAGNAQYWYGETFRIRQLYTDAATAYLDGYQKYPKSSKGPINLLKLGVTLVQIGEKKQGCSMITGVSKQYPKAKQSVLLKAEYEKKKYECIKQSS